MEEVQNSSSATSYGGRQ